MRTHRASLGRRLLAAALCLGLIASLTTGAYAANSVKPAAAFQGGFAVLLPTGQAVHSRNVTGARLAGPGRYEVDFSGNITKCALIATLSSPSSGNPFIGTIGTTTSPVNPRAVFVQIQAGGTAMPGNASFALNVVC